MGYERKRGKLEQFNALLRAEQSGDAAAAAFSDIVGDCAQLGAIKYVITLDTDTQLPRDAAQALVGNLAHPLNRPVIDPARGRVTEGYAILQPRASISLPSACRTRFTRLFAGEAGIDPYTREVSDVYQDLFGEGSFIGKGIYDVDAFRQAVDGRFPENRILSHDLLESGYARSGLVTDIDLVEEHPATYATEASRRHRWIRGDWQIAGWVVDGAGRGGIAIAGRARLVHRTDAQAAGTRLARSFQAHRHGGSAAACAGAAGPDHTAVRRADLPRCDLALRGAHVVHASRPVAVAYPQIRAPQCLPQPWRFLS